MPATPVAGWPGWEDLPSGFIIHETPGSYYLWRAAVELRSANTGFLQDDLTRGQDLYANRLKALWEWAQQHGYAVRAYGTRRPQLSIGSPSVAVRLGRVHTTFYLAKNADRDLLVSHVDGLTLSERNIKFNCACCGQRHYLGTVVCPSTDELIACPGCGQWGHKVTHAFGAYFSCTNCGQRCGHPGCTNSVPPFTVSYCSTHGEHRSCENCGNVVEWLRGSASAAPPLVNGHYYCHACVDDYCPGCRRVIGGSMGFSAVHNANVCVECRRSVLRQSNEEFDDGATSKIETLLTIPGREAIRTCGIEIEGANGTRNGGILAQRLYALRYSLSDIVVEHQSGSRYGKVHVERDSSVDWECVIGPLNMADQTDAQILDRTVREIRGFVKSKELSLDLRCGLHIHVSAERVGLHQAYNLSHIFTYLEDPLFRIAAAKWPYHRASQGSHYCAPIPKFERKTDFYVNQGGHGRGRDNHYFALSFSNYFNAKMRNCTCGAVSAGMWDECTCPNLGKCTFEFRLFNTTANPKKVIAYLALCQALVAKAIATEEISNPSLTYPGLEFNQQVFKEMDASAQRDLGNEWRPRLHFILNELPLTRDEREAVIYCIKNSEINAAISESEIRSMMTQEVAA